MRLNRRRSGKTCSRSRILVAIVLLMLLAAVALTIGSRAVKLRADKAANPQAFSLAHATLPSRVPSAKGVPQVLANYSRLPLIFEPNQGQTDARVKFQARGSGYGLYLTAQEAVLALQRSAADPHHPTAPTSALSMKLVGTASPAEPTGEIQLPGKSNYLIGNDPDNGIVTFLSLRACATATFTPALT